MARDAGEGEAVQLPHAGEMVRAWTDAWTSSGRLLLLLDFDGTLAPIVERPEMAALPPETRAALQRLLGAPGVQAAVVSGRGMADARKRAGIEGVPYAGNHGMEIEGPNVHRVHPEAAAARPALVAIRDRLSERLGTIDGVIVEDKGLTLSIHYRLVARDRVQEVRESVHSACSGNDSLRVTEGKEVLEIRPRVDWDKGKAVEFLLDHFEPAAGAPVLYIGDDTTDEDAFEALRRRGAGDGVVVGDPPPQSTAATAYVRDPAEVAALFSDLAAHGPE